MSNLFLCPLLAKIGCDNSSLIFVFWKNNRKIFLQIPRRVQDRQSVTLLSET